MTDLNDLIPTKELPRWIPLHRETIQKLRRLGADGPFKEGRDYVFVGISNGKLLWDLDQTEQSLRLWKRPSKA
jgi:hypothetical protein